jgi:hypothetical protein
VYTTYHAGQNAVWAYWMRTAFALSTDPAVLRQVLMAGSESVAGFVEDMVAALSEQLRQERAELIVRGFALRPGWAARADTQYADWLEAREDKGASTARHDTG